MKWFPRFWGQWRPTKRSIFWVVPPTLKESAQYVDCTKHGYICSVRPIDHSKCLCPSKVCSSSNTNSSKSHAIISFLQGPLPPSKGPLSYEQKTPQCFHTHPLGMWWLPSFITPVIHLRFISFVHLFNFHSSIKTAPEYPTSLLYIS